MNAWSSVANLIMPPLAGHIPTISERSIGGINSGQHKRAPTFGALPKRLHNFDATH